MKILRHLYLLPLMMIVALMACSHIDEDERLIFVKPVAASRNVLIEDFTGQRCVNCPNATEEIEKLIAQYGGDNVIAVGIHSGPFAKSVRGVPYSLYTETGDEYFNYWKVESQPKGVVDRKGTSDYTSWATFVREEMEKTAPLSLNVTSEYDGEKHEAFIRVDAEGTDGNTSGHLQVWLSRVASRLSNICPTEAPIANMCTTMCSARRSTARGERISPLKKENIR
jgi:hypothetical protein